MGALPLIKIIQKHKNSHTPKIHPDEFFYLKNKSE
jgi:hypothetical protein